MRSFKAVQFSSSSLKNKIIQGMTVESIKSIVSVSPVADTTVLKIFSISIVFKGTLRQPRLQANFSSENCPKPVLHYSVHKLKPVIILQSGLSYEALFDV